jgi:hypothetical protein
MATTEGSGDCQWKLKDFTEPGFKFAFLHGWGMSETWTRDLCRPVALDAVHGHAGAAGQLQPERAQSLTITRLQHVMVLGSVWVNDDSAGLTVWYRHGHKQCKRFGPQDSHEPNMLAISTATHTPLAVHKANVKAQDLCQSDTGLPAPQVPSIHHEKSLTLIRLHSICIDCLQGKMLCLRVQRPAEERVLTRELSSTSQAQPNTAVHIRPSADLLGACTMHTMVQIQQACNWTFPKPHLRITLISLKSLAPLL